MLQDRANILIVDNDQRILRLVRLNLERAGFVVDTAGNGTAALERFSEQPPDAVVLDVTMPGKGTTFFFTLPDLLISEAEPANYAPEPEITISR